MQFAIFYIYIQIQEDRIWDIQWKHQDLIKENDFFNQKFIPIINPEHINREIHWCGIDGLGV